MKSLTKCKFIPLFFVLISCVIRYDQSAFLDNFQIIDKVIKNNVVSCLYRRNVAISLKNNYHGYRYKFRGLLDSRCEEGFIVNILGAFNQVVAKVIVEPENVMVINNKRNVSTSRIYSYLERENIGELIDLLSFPYILPDKSYRVSKLKGGYLLAKDKTKITVNSQYNIVKIGVDGKKISYQYRNNNINRISYKDINSEVNVDFL